MSKKSAHCTACSSLISKEPKNTHIAPSRPLSVQHGRDASVYVPVHTRLIFSGYCCVVQLFLITAWQN